MNMLLRCNGQHRGSSVPMRGPSYTMIALLALSESPGAFRMSSARFQCSAPLALKYPVLPTMNRPSRARLRRTIILS